MLRSFFPAPAFEAPDPANGQPWYQGKITDAETITHLTSKGWEKDLTAAAVGAVQAHLHAQKFIGAPPEQLLHIPKDPHDPKWADVHQRLGMPKDAKEYDLSTVKGAGDKPIDDTLADVVRKMAHSLNLPKDRAPALAQAIVKLDIERNAAANADKAAKIADEKAALDKNWGANKEANLFIARQAAAKLGISPEEVNALENAAGFAKTMEMLRMIGIRIGEDKFIRNEDKPGGGVMSKAEAQAKLTELKTDRDFVARYMKGGVAETRQMTDLMKIISAP